jgi:predicted GNAT superfamily acetyltransferase
VILTIDIRKIDGVEEVQEVEVLQKEVWGISDLDVTPLTQLVAARETGGQLIGAFDASLLVGFVYGFVGIEHGQITHHSHMLAVKPAYRDVDIGYRLKLAQREAVLAQGITRITWTFDPLQSLNAHFNFCKLGVVSDQYRVNFYGAETSSFLHQGGTDRLWVTWLLNSDRVRQCVAGTTRRVEISPEQLRIEIPADINGVRREDPKRAAGWRETARRAFCEALAEGFLVEDFIRRQSCGVYVLTRGRTIEDIP